LVIKPLLLNSGSVPQTAFISKKESPLPADLLIEIFIETLPPGPLDARGRSTFQIIRSVCPAWRSLSFASPVLWSSLSIDSPSSQEKPDDYFTLASAWFSRAGSSISLELTVHEQSSSISAEQKTALEKLIWRYQSRWRYLFLDLSSAPYFFDIILGVPAEGWSSLSELGLFTYHFADLESTDANVYKTLQSIESLQRIHLVDSRSSEIDQIFSHPALSSLHLELPCTPFSTSHVQLLSRYLHLESLQLDTPDMIAKYHLLDNNEVCTLPCLLSLSLTTTSLALLPHLVTPNLRSLRIDLVGDTYMGDLLNLVLFLTQCTDSVKSFELYHDQVESRDNIAGLIPLLAHRPSITSITLDIWSFTTEEPFPRKVLVERKWCPQLRELRISKLERDSMAQWDEEEVTEEEVVSLASLFKTRSELGMPRLDRLTIRKGLKDFKFPYELFENVGVDTIDVRVPWSVR
jgi:hypothetical protein